MSHSGPSTESQKITKVNSSSDLSKSSKVWLPKPKLGGTMTKKTGPNGEVAYVEYVTPAQMALAAKKDIEQQKALALQLEAEEAKKEKNQNKSKTWAAKAESENKPGKRSVKVR